MIRSGWLRSRALQALGVILLFGLVGVWSRGGDGLWFQGDAPRHAMNGLFWWDLLGAMPRHPLTYAVSYYARYPVIAPATYPPLFYVIEGVAFAAAGPSPYVARVLIFSSAIAAGLYTLAYIRRWIDPGAGWMALFLAFVPAFVIWSSTVMLNVPATSLALAALYHGRRWLETSRGRQLVLTAVFVAAVFLTYYPGIIVIAVLAAWATFRTGRAEGHVRQLVAVAAIGVIPLAVVLFLTPVHTARNLPTLAFLLTASTWTYYWRALPAVVGWGVLTIGVCGCVAGLADRRWRGETGLVIAWVAAPILCVSALPARDARYILLIPPALLVSAAIGLAAAAARISRPGLVTTAALFLAGLIMAGWSASQVQVPQVSGFRDVALYLREHGPTDAVLYDGSYEGVFGFYTRALDPRFERRLVLANRFLYDYGPATTFRWKMQSAVASTDDVVSQVRTRCGCRWVAVETGNGLRWFQASRLLREALQRPEFELARSFPISGAGDRRVDVYRVLAAVEPVTAIDLRFPSLTDRVFLHVVPVTR
jgi:hypothetical protein